MALHAPILLQLADLLTFVVMVSRLGMAAEVNPVVHALGFEVAVAAKVGLLIYLTTLAPSMGRYKNAVGVLAALAGGVGTASNLIALAG